MDRSADRLYRGERAALAPRSGSRRRAVSRSPSPARFDPTAYVKVREEKLRAARASREAEKRTRGRSPSPRRRGASPSGSVYNSGGRGRSSERRGAAASYTRQTSRSPATSRKAGNTSRSNSRDRAGGYGGGNFRREGGGAATATSTATVGTMMASPAGGSVGRPLRGASSPLSPRGGARLSPTSAAAAAVAVSGAAEPAAARSAATSTALPSYFQRSAEITDIDARLQALQTFLATAKGAPST